MRLVVAEQRARQDQEPVEDTGRNSVTPSTMPRRTAVSRSFKHDLPRSRNW